MKVIDLTNRRFGKLVAIKRIENNKQGKSQWLCICDCGEETCVVGNNLLSGGTCSCGCSKHKPAHNFKDLTDCNFGKLKVIKRNGKRSTRVKWLCRCFCGRFTSVCSKELLNGDTKSCGCLQSEKNIYRNWKGHEDIPGNYFTNILNGAKKRKIPFNITIIQMWDLFIIQNKKCILTGIELSFGCRSKRFGIKEQTASLDRIDSKKGYTIDNLQWVHKKVQHMKNKYPQEEYIEFCKLVAQNYK